MPKLFTSSADKPTMKVLRIQHKDSGVGPYLHPDERVQQIMAGSELPSPQTSRGFTDEDIRHLEDPNIARKFGFLSEQHMLNTVGKDRLAKLKEHGFEPAWHDADHVWHGDGKQVFFSTPEQSDKQAEKLNQIKAKTKYKEISPSQLSPEEIARYNTNINKMDSLADKLQSLKKGMMNAGLGGPGSVKAGAVMPSRPKSFKLPGSTNSATPSTGIPAPTSKKNPIKVAEQTHNKDIKDIKMKEAQSVLKVIKSEEVIKIADNGQWSLEKSGYKGYTDADNVRRKANNIGEDTGIHSMNRIKKWGGSGANAADREAKEMRRKSKKNPVKEFSAEEIAQVNADRSSENN